MNPDDYITGTFDDRNPANEIEVDAEIVDTWNNLTEAYESGHVDEIFKIINEAREEIDKLLYCLESVESGLAGKARNIKELLK